MKPMETDQKAGDNGQPEAAAAGGGRIISLTKKSTRVRIVKEQKLEPHIVSDLYHGNEEEPSRPPKQLVRGPDGRFREVNGEADSPRTTDGFLSSIASLRESVQDSTKATRFFMIKCRTIDNIRTSMQKGLWASTRSNSNLFQDAYKTSQVVLFFSANQSGGMQGYALMSSGLGEGEAANCWGDVPPGLLGENFQVIWLRIGFLPFNRVENLTNPMNENKQIKICRDGQELPPQLGHELLRRFERETIPNAQIDDLAATLSSNMADNIHEYKTRKRKTELTRSIRGYLEKDGPTPHQYYHSSVDYAQPYPSELSRSFSATDYYGGYPMSGYSHPPDYPPHGPPPSWSSSWMGPTVYDDMAPPSFGYPHPSHSYAAPPYRDPYRESAYYNDYDQPYGFDVRPELLPDRPRSREANPPPREVRLKENDNPDNRPRPLSRDHREVDPEMSRRMPPQLDRQGFDSDFDRSPAEEMDRQGDRDSSRRMDRYMDRRVGRNMYRRVDRDMERRAEDPMVNYYKTLLDGGADRRRYTR